ncbi:hypothetical protein QQF64_034120 [Cirrhinus molitorella]|uniref:Coiled-coil domain-containing protein 106-like n=1 Tax=Cirrhinus molitorella TaxID=172907 RepID=A0ABR3MVU1_9TELE
MSRSCMSGGKQPFPSNMKSITAVVSLTQGYTPNRRRQTIPCKHVLSSSDSELPKHKKRKLKEKHRERRHKKSKKLTSDYSKREHTPEESLKRYYKVLNLVKQGLSKAEAYNRLNVDRNTIVIQAPIAELAAANPESFRKLRQMFKKGDSILKFDENLLSLCKEKANEDMIKQMKEANDLLDINKK